MNRLAVFSVHILAVPLALLLSLVLAVVLPPPVPQRAVEVALNDTYFVIAHFHPSIALASLVLVTTVVAYGCHSLNWALRTAWIFLLLHVVAALIAWHVSVAWKPDDSAIVSILPPAHPGSAYLYLGSAAASLVVTLIALLVSLVRALQSPELRAA